MRQSGIRGAQGALIFKFCLVSMPTSSGKFGIWLSPGFSLRYMASSKFHIAVFKSVGNFSRTYESHSQGSSKCFTIICSRNIGDCQEVQQYHPAMSQQRRDRRENLHPNEPRVIYPSVYVSDVPVEWNEVRS